MVDYDEAPLGSFHYRVAAASTAGVFSDGFGLGVIGIALSLATPQLGLSPLWVGLLGGASLAGLFLGALCTGPLADRFGRRPIFAYNMGVLAVCSGLQFMVSSSSELLVLRLVIGLLLGTDYVVSKTLFTEFMPRASRGRFLSVLSVAWAGGYACAYFVGVALSACGDDAWRWMLLSSVVPCAVVLPLRLVIPETPLWLMSRGRLAEATRVVRSTVGMGVSLPQSSPPALPSAGCWRQLFAEPLRRRTLVGCAFFTCQVVPYFAVGTFVARVMAALNVAGAHLGGVVYNGALLLGAIAGLGVVDRLSRRSFLIGSFGFATAAMLPLILWSELPSVLIVGLFALFACVLSAASNLVYVYLPELFPTDLRASGIGLAIATSRIGSAASTFLLPVLVASMGIRIALGACATVLAVGGLICLVWAPETKHLRLGEVEGRA